MWKERRPHPGDERSTRPMQTFLQSAWPLSMTALLRLRPRYLRPARPALPHASRRSPDEIVQDVIPLNRGDRVRRRSRCSRGPVSHHELQHARCEALYGTAPPADVSDGPARSRSDETGGRQRRPSRSSCGSTTRPVDPILERDRSRRSTSGCAIYSLTGTATGGIN